MDEQDTRDSDLGSSTAKKDVPKTGKDHVPEYSGDSPMREYQRRVRLFEASTGIDPSYRAQKLMERLTGQAWRATESLDLDEIKHPDGVKRLLQHLWQELEPLEYLRTFTTLADFYKGFKRSPGMEYITYDMEFRAHLKRLEEIGAKIEGLTQAFWFIEKAGLSGELRKQVVAAAGGEYDYVKLRRALLAIVPRVNKEEDNGASTRLPPGGNRHWKARSNHPPRQVHATMDDGLDDAEKEQVEEAEPEMDSADLEGELEVLLTQAAKKRAQIERARGFAKNETPPEREQRIKDMKARMPCSACKAHGKTVYGHWHGDAACPYRKDKDKNVLAVVAEQLSDSDSDQEGLLGPSASDVFLATSPDDGAGEPEGNDAEEVWVGASSSVRVQGVSQLTLALSDTCCARTVAGEKWAQNHLKHLLKLREDSFVVPESRPFRFGAGPRIMSSYAIIIPVNISKADRWAHLRVSIVDQDVPLLISKTALKQLGAVLDLANGCVCFQRLSTSVPLRETRSGLCGFDINLDSSRRTCSSPPPELLEDDCEIVLSDINKHPQEGVWMTDDHPPDAGAFQQGSREAHQECESRAKELLRNHEYSYSALLDLVRRLPLGKRQRHRHINDGQGQSNIPWVAGLFVHGNMIGITKRTAKYPHVVKYINMFMRHQCDVQWSSFALQRDVCTSIHKDVHNDKAADSVTVTFGDFSGGRLWVMNQEGETSDVVWKQDPQGRSLPGRLVDTFEKPTVFSPHVPHATDDWQGERWCLTMYRTRGAAQVDQDTKKALARLRFPLGKSSASRTFGNATCAYHDAMLSSCYREPQERRDGNCDDARTPQLEGDLSSSCETLGSTSAYHDATSGDTEEEGRLCAGHRVLVAGLGSRAEGAHRGPAQGDLQCAQAEASTFGTAGSVEEAGFGEPQGAVCIEGGQGSGQAERQPLEPVDSLPADSGDRTLASGHPELTRAPAGRRVSLSEVQRVPDTDDRSNEPCNQRRILGLQTLPELPHYPPHGVCRQAGQGSDRRHRDLRPGDDQEQVGEGFGGNDHQEGEEGQAGHHGPAPQGASGVSSRFQWARGVIRRVVGADGSNPGGGGIVRGRTVDGPEVQCQPHGGRDQDHRRDEAKGQCNSDQRRASGQVSPLEEGQNGAGSTEDASYFRKPLAPEIVHERIRQGRARRAEMKKGTVKRLLGNTRALIGAVFISTVAAAGAALQAVPGSHRKRADVLEIFDGRAHVSSTFSHWGFHVQEPIRVTGDISDEDGRDEVIKWIEHEQPRLVVMSNCCPTAPPVYAFHRNQQQAKRRERRWKERQAQAVKFLHDICDAQLKRGDHVLAELPFGEHWGVQTLAQSMIKHPNIQCVYDWDLSGKPSSKHVWAVSSKYITDELESTASKGRDHIGRDVRQGDVESKKRDFCRAVCTGFIKHLRDNEPGRMRRLLRSLAARIRYRVHAGDRDVRSLRWSEKTIMRALKQWNAVYAQEGEQSERSGDDEEMIPAVEEPNPRSSRSPGDVVVEQPAPPQEAVRSGLSSNGITFEVPPGRRLEESVKQGLIRAHCSLGHPGQSDLQRFLKLGGAKQEVVEAVSWMRCLTCAHAKRPSTHRVSSIPPSQITFGDEVQLDCICIHDASKQQHWFLSIIDRATSYHLIELMRDHSPAELHRAFDRGWCKWAGPPLRVSVDLEGGFQGHEFWHAVGNAGTSLSAIGGTAHWQQGKIERHNQTIKEMMSKTIRHTQPKGREDMRRLAREVAWAKNSLVREHGWSPVALVFGREPRVFGELHQGGNPASFHPSVGDQGSDVAVRMRYRYHAKMEFIKSQARQMLLRTAHIRTRRLPIPKIGQLVFFWRAENSKKRDSQSKWVGPGYIVGIQDRNAWVACGGRCYLVAGEHLREASGDERHYGDPMLQKALALFKKVPREATYEDLVGQPDPQEEPQNLEQEPLAQDVSHDMEVDPLNDADLPQEYARIKGHIGWHVDSKSNPVLVSYKAWAFRSPEPRYSSERFPWRTSWACINGEWRCLENEVKWLELQDCHQFVPQGPASILITIFQNRTRKEMCLDDVPHDVKRRKAQPQPHQTHAVYQGKKQTQSQTKLKRMMEKEIPYDMIPCQDRDLYKAAEEKEWQSWVDYDSCKILSLEESRQVEQERPDRILPSRYVFRNKNAGLKDTNGDPLPVKAKARLCLLGHLCPDSKSGQVQVDSPTIERVSTMIFLHLVTSYGWANNWFIGDISNAFLQGAPLEGKPDMFMRQPKQGLKGLQPGQLLKLLKPVYGRPDAPRAWYNELSRILETELGFSKSQVDPALFFLRDNQGQLKALMVVHVDDVMICHDGSALGRETAQRLHERFPFGTWLEVAKQEAGVSYCGKEIKVCEREGEQCVTLSQNAFLEGRLQPMAIDANRSKDHDMRANQTELTDYRSVVGSLQWLAVQSRPDLAFECNQLQKRVSDLRVRDLHRANKAVRDALKHRFEILFRPLGKDAELVTFHDAGLYSSLGVEIEEREAEDILQAGNERKLIYSQKGVCVGFVKRGATNAHERAHYNLIDWKSATNRRVVESSFASETHAALMGHNMSRFAQVLLAEIRFGSEVVAAVEDDGWQDLCPVTLITDCKSIYDTVHKDGQHVGEKGNIVHAVLLRQLLTTRGETSKARLMWVPTRCQVADGLTKGARGADIREQLERGLLFHERALKKSRGLHVQRTDQRDSDIGVSVAKVA